MIINIILCYQLEGADSRKRSVEAGLIETVLKLVDGPEPIQVYRTVMRNRIIYFACHRVDSCLTSLSCFVLPFGYASLS